MGSLRVNARLAPPPLQRVANAFARVLHRNLPRNIDVHTVTWTPPPAPLCHALVAPRAPPPIPPEPDNAHIAWAIRLRRLHVLTAWAFASAVEDFGEALGHEGERVEGASVSVMEVRRYGPLGRVHLLECDEAQAAVLARHVEAGRVPNTVQPLVGALPVTTLCSTLFTPARAVHVHFAPGTFGMRTPLQAERAVPEPLVWAGAADAEGRVCATKAYPPLRRLSAAQRRELEAKLLGKDDALARLCAALVAEGRDAAQAVRDEHVAGEQARLEADLRRPPDPTEYIPPRAAPPPAIHPTGVGASRARRRAK